MNENRKGERGNALSSSLWTALYTDSCRCKYRINLLKGILKRQNEVEEKIRTGEWTRYRSGKDIARQKLNRAGKTKANWFMRDNIRSTVSIQITPHGTLANQLRDSLKKIQDKNNQTQVIEKAGIPIYSGLKVTDVNNKLGCQYVEECKATNKTDCTTMKLTYRLDCTYCHPEEDRVNSISPINRSIYVGCAGRSLHARTLDHVKDLKAGDQGNAIVKHMVAQHENRDWKSELPIRVRVVTGHSTTLRRLIDESLRLEKNQGLANSKGEWGRGGGLVRAHNKRTIE